MLKILVVSNIRRPFVTEDVGLLSRIGATRLLVYRGRRDLPRLAASIMASDVVVCWFVLGYAFTSVALGSLFHKRTLLIAGGWDVVGIPELGYGALLSRGREQRTRFALRHASEVLAVSEALKADVVRIFPRPVRVGSNAVDTDFFTAEGEARSRSVATVIGVDNEGRYRAKGVDFLFAVAKAMPDTPFLIAGGNAPEWQSYMLDRAPSNATLLGYLDREQLRSLYRSIRVYVQLSAFESFGVALAEAMSCGCFPVVSDRGGLPEVVGDAGIVTPFGDVGKAIAAIRNGLDTEGSLAAARRARERFALGRREAMFRDVIAEMK